MTSRVPPDQVLAGRRITIMATLKAQPGLGFRELSKASGVAAGTLNHHLNVLERHGYAWSISHGPKRRTFPGRRPDDVAALAAARKAGLGPGMQTLLAFVQGHPFCCQREVFDAFPGMPRSTVQHTLARLEREGFVRRSFYGRYCRYQPVGPAPPAPMPARLAAAMAEVLA